MEIHSPEASEGEEYIFWDVNSGEKLGCSHRFAQREFRSVAFRPGGQRDCRRAIRRQYGKRFGTPERGEQLHKLQSGIRLR